MSYKQLNLQTIFEMHGVCNRNAERQLEVLYFHNTEMSDRLHKEVLDKIEDQIYDCVALPVIEGADWEMNL